jgi:hypothetical protein
MLTICRNDISLTLFHVDQLSAQVALLDTFIDDFLGIFP